MLNVPNNPKRLRCHYFTWPFLNELPFDETDMHKNRHVQGLRYHQLLCALTASFLLCIGLSVPANATEELHLIKLTGTGTLKLVPDTALITLGINVRGNDLSELQFAADSAVNNILAKLRALNIEDKDLAATNIRIAPRYRYDKGRQESVTNGYQVSRDISVTVRNMTLLSSVMSEASDAGINTISPPQLSSSRYEESYLKALGAAVDQAKKRAQRLAEAADVRLGPVVHMTTQQQSYRPQPPMMMRAMESDSPESATYQPGELVVSASVDVTFAISP
jgi:uncharacterized protein YggE